MNRERFRSLGAIIGLAAGFAIMFLLGLTGLLWGAFFGAGGAVLGGMSGERLYDRGQR